MTCSDFDYFTPEWCPGCGNFDILDCVKQALCDLQLKPNEIVIAMGIGQASKLGFSVKANVFDGLHGRSLPLALGMKLANHDARVLAVAGDADFYAEGTNHLIHNLRRNLDVTILAGDNRVFGLTKGQAAPTAASDYATTVYADGVGAQPIRPTMLALAAGATFVAKAFSGNKDELTELIKQGVQHRGAAIIDVMFPCVSFNKVNTFSWFKQRATPIGPDHDPSNLESALKLAMLDMQDGDRIPTGVYYRVERPVFGENLAAEKGEPIAKRTLSYTPERVRPLFDQFK